MIKNLKFPDDKTAINEYLNKRIADHAMQYLINLSESQENMGNIHLDLPASTAEVEKSFNHLNKMLGKDRGFADENITKYFFLKYNKFV